MRKAEEMAAIKALASFNFILVKIWWIWKDKILN